MLVTVKNVPLIALWIGTENILMFLILISDNGLRSQQQTKNRKTILCKYCVCAWGLPAIAVLACFTLDYTDTVKIGYGKRLGQLEFAVWNNMTSSAEHVRRECSSTGSRK